MDSSRGFLTPVPFGSPEFMKSVRNPDRNFYLVEQGNEQFFVQTGHSGYVPAYCDCVPFMSEDEIKKMVDQCFFLICHAGVGSILLGLKKTVKVIVVPRLKEYGEHVDDHQSEIAESFAKAGYIRMVKDVSKLGEEIERNREWKPLRFESNKERFNKMLIKMLNE